MSNTTKIDKVRVNGVLYDLAGSGGGSSTGGYFLPSTLFTVESLGYSEGSNATYTTADAMKLWLADCGVDLEQVILEYNTTESTISIIGAPSVAANGELFSINLNATSGTPNQFSIVLRLFDDTIAAGLIDLQEGDILTLGAIIDIAFGFSIEGNVGYLYDLYNIFQQGNGIDIFANMIYIYRYSINYYTYYSTFEVEEFIDSVIQEYVGGGSSSSSS